MTAQGESETLLPAKTATTPTPNFTGPAPPAAAAGSRRKCVGIVGTGDYARALSKRLIFSGYDVVLGSRAPAARQLAAFDECLCGVTVTSVSDCVARCDLLVAAVHVENFKVTLAPRAGLFAGKVVVDVSNRTNRYAATSNAEYLQSLLPEAAVVKAFNSVSACALEEQAFAAGTNRVYVGSDDAGAKERVMELARDLGFAPCDLGGLRAARSMEAFVLKVFPGWKVPLFFAFGVFNLWALYCVYIYYIDTSTYHWDQVFLKVLNKPLCMTAITTLSSVYLAGSVAGVLQLYRGTKYRRFPRLLNAWLVSRRPLGLISLALVLLHALASAMMLSPTYFHSWYRHPLVVLPANLTQPMAVMLEPAWMIWKGELACLLGLLALFLLCLVGLTSLPSISASLNWAEWRFVQSKLGLAGLALALAHAVVMGAPHWAEGWAATLRSISFLSSLLPALTLTLRLLLALPPLGRRLRRIRHGWESRQPVPREGPSTSAGPRRSNLKRAGAAAAASCGNGGSVGLGLAAKGRSPPIYTAIEVEKDLEVEAEEARGGAEEEEGEEGGCRSCGEENVRVQPSLPTRTCDCSV